MLQFLSRRWWGVSGWTFLLSLMLAAFMFWVLPTSRAVHQWSFQGLAYVVGFMNQGRTLLVKQIRHDGYCRYKINLQSGHVEQCIEPVAMGQDELQQTSKVPYSLTRTVYFANEKPCELILTDGRTGKAHTIPGNNSDIYLGVGGGVIGGRKSSEVKELETSGRAAMSLDERWLLITHSQPMFWNNLIVWLRQKTGWTLSFVSEGSIYHATAIDLLNDVRTVFSLRAARVPEFDVHPQGLGFAVVEGNPGYLALPSEKNNYQTMIEWYSLPLRPAFHSFQQWCLIFAAFAVPVGSSMLWNLLRRKGRAPVSVPPHP